MIITLSVTLGFSVTFRMTLICKINLILLYFNEKYYLLF
jgi:hypothetical protein